MPSLEDVQRVGFPVGGEPLLALDLVDTLMTAADPPTDLLADAAQAGEWWRLQSSRLPGAPPPDPLTTRRLRAAVRDLFDAHLQRREPLGTSIEDINAAAAAAPTSLRLVNLGQGALQAQTRWHTEHGGNALIALAAREAIELLSTPRRLQRLRRCANPACSMLFLAENTRRQWCADNVCGNRARVARHYQRTRTPHTAPPARRPTSDRKK
jgi:predicted RNA-binding Zn ribbon-like protein